jgi:hypothetical protein
VEAEFGADDKRRSIKALLALKQSGTVEEYQKEFQSLVYQVSMYTPHYDEQFFISQFIKGLKSELRGGVESQVPETLERVFLLARVQQEVLEETRKKGYRAVPHARGETVTNRAEVPKSALKFATGDLWKDRQLRDYRRANNLFSLSSSSRKRRILAPHAGDHCRQRGSLHLVSDLGEFMAALAVIRGVFHS